MRFFGVTIGISVVILCSILSRTTSIRHYIHLHFIVLIWGFTGILGKLISLDAFHLVWYRLFIALFSLAIIILFKKVQFKKQYVWQYLFMGLVVAIHWLTFYGAIKLSNVSVALSAFSCCAFFTSIIEPIVFKRRIRWQEVAPGILVIAGMYIIFDAELKYFWGIILGIAAALTASLFSTFNGLWANRSVGYEITLLELLGAFIGLSLFLGLAPGFQFPNFQLSNLDWCWLVILGVGCTVYPFIAVIGLMKHFKPFTISLTVNLEPIYTIIMAIYIFKSSEYMNANFYIGASITLSAVLIYPFLKNRVLN